MSITVIDYGSGNLKSAAKALEAAANNINLNLKVVVTSDPKIIKESKKIILPGQGSFRDCYLGIKKISGLVDTLNEFVLVKKNLFLEYVLVCNYLLKLVMNLKKQKVLVGWMRRKKK